MIVYHGTSAELFHSFSHSHILEGDGKIKYGYGIYFSQIEATGILYAFKRPNCDKHFVYKANIPDHTEESYLEWDVPTSPAIIERLNCQFGLNIKQGATGKDIYSALEVNSKNKEEHTQQLKLAAKRLSQVGVVGMAFPRNWKSHPTQRVGNYNYSVFDENNISIIEVKQYEGTLKGPLCINTIIF